MSIQEYFKKYDLTTFDGRKAALTELLGLRTENGDESTGDIDTFKPELLEYLPGEDREKAKGETVVVRFRPDRWMLNGLEYVQGGILASMMDCVCGPMSDVVSNGHSAGTLDMLTTYFRPITMKDDEIIVRVCLTENSKRVMHFELKLFNSKGKLAVEAVTNIMKAVS